MAGERIERFKNKIADESGDRAARRIADHLTKKTDERRPSTPIPPPVSEDAGSNSSQGELRAKAKEIVHGKINANIQEMAKKTAVVVSVANLANLLLLRVYKYNPWLGLVFSLGINTAIAHNLRSHAQTASITQAIMSNPNGLFKPNSQDIGDEIKKILLQIVIGGASIYDHFTSTGNSL